MTFSPESTAPEPNEPEIADQAYSSGPLPDQEVRSPTASLALLIAMAAMVAFFPVVTNAFIEFDDPALIYENPDFTPPQPSQWGHYWTAPNRSLYMPLTNTAWGLLSAVAWSPPTSTTFGAIHALAFHLASLCLHGLNALWVFLILRRLFGVDWPAFFGAMLFAIHPLQTEAVAWASEFSILLSGFFSLTAMWCFFVFSDASAAARSEGLNADVHAGSDSQSSDDEEAAESRRRMIGGLYYAAGTIALILALLAKAPAVVTPVMIGIIEFTRRRGHINRNFVLALSLWLVLCIPIAWTAHNVQTSTFTVSWPSRFVVAGDALAFYLCKLALPIRLMPIYGRTPAWLFSQPLQAYTTWLAPAGLLLVAVLLRRRLPWLLAMVLLFIVALAPVLGFNLFAYQRVSTTADRYVYLAMLAPAILLTLTARAVWGRTIVIFCCVIFAICGVLSARQAAYWQDTLKLFSRVIEAHPNNLRARTLVALAYNTRSHELLLAEDSNAAAVALRQSREQYLIAAALPEDAGVSYYDAGDCSVRLRDAAAAIDYLSRALADPRFKPDLIPLAYDERGECQLFLRQWDKARDDFDRAIATSGKTTQEGIHLQAQRHLASIDRYKRRAQAARPTSRLTPRPLGAPFRLLPGER